jgi:hypothetical protein
LYPNKEEIAMSAYVPNVGEKEDLKAKLATNAIQLVLYKNLVIPDGNTIFDTLEEMPTGGGRGYAPMELSPVVVEDVLTASKWFLSLNSSGKAQAQYHNAALQWVMTAADVADGNTVQGVAGFCWVLPFDAGGGVDVSGKTRQIKVGDFIYGSTSHATGIVTGVMLQSGSWTAGTAAGYLNIMTKTGTFQDNEEITIQGAIATGAVVAGGTGYAVGDIITVTQAGAAGAKIVVLTVNTGAVVTFAVVNGGQGYSVASALPTVKVTGSGNNDFTFTISTLATTKYAETNTGAIGDAHKRLLFLEPMTTPTVVNTVGQPFNCTPVITVSTAT